MRRTLAPLLLVALAACAPTPPAAVASDDASPRASEAAVPDLAALAAGSWRLVEIDGRSVLADPGAQRVALRFEDDRLVGAAPCNSMAASFTLGPGTIRFGPVMASKRACDALALERELFDVLGSVEQAQLDGGALRLSGGGRSLVLHRIAFRR